MCKERATKKVQSHAPINNSNPKIKHMRIKGLSARERTNEAAENHKRNKNASGIHFDFLFTLAAVECA